MTVTSLLTADAVLKYEFPIHVFDLLTDEIQKHILVNYDVNHSHQAQL